MKRIVIIGDEILSGKFADENAALLIRDLRELGVRLSRITIIPDDVEEIAETVPRFSRRFDFVFTSGGVGPTHDDVTMEGIARGFGTRVIRHPALEDLLRQFYQSRLQPGHLRLADVPEGAVAARTKRIRIGTQVTPIGLRHPVFVARWAATLDQVSNGRFRLGVGLGHQEVEYVSHGFPYPSFKARYARLTEGIEIIRRLLTESEPVTFEGEHFSVKDVNMWPKQHPYEPTVHDLHNNGRLFPPNYLHQSWLDYLYWDAVLEP